MPRRIVSRVVDPTRMPRLTDAQRAELAALRDLPDETIDTDDIAPLGPRFLGARGVQSVLPANRAATTVRIDADVLAWLNPTRLSRNQKGVAYLPEACSRRGEDGRQFVGALR